RRADHRLGERPARGSRGVAPHGEGCAQPAAYHPRRRRVSQAATDSLQPLEVLLAAERAALLSGRDDEFTMLVAIGYTGTRWGETIGLERDFVLPTLIDVECQLREIRGRFFR